MNTARPDLVALIGIDYLTECVMGAVMQRISEENYRVYITDCLYGISAGLGNKPVRRYFDILHPAPVDNRTGEEIAIEHLEKLGIKVVD